MKTYKFRFVVNWDNRTLYVQRKMWYGFRTEKVSYDHGIYIEDKVFQINFSQEYLFGKIYDFNSLIKNLAPEDKVRKLFDEVLKEKYSINIENVKNVIGYPIIEIYRGSL